MKTKKTHRRYPDQDWDYKAISTLMNDDGTIRDVMYHTLKNKGKLSQAVEVYSGENYVVGSKGRSFSRKYSLTELPDKYKTVVAELKKVHKATKWSTAKKVNEN